MTLTSGRYIGHEYDRMIVLFSMQDGGKEIPCAISTTAMAGSLRYSDLVYGFKCVSSIFAYSRCSSSRRGPM